MIDQYLEMENDREVYKTLLESTNAIPWKIDWLTMQFTYIGPQIEKLLGWPQDSWKGIDEWVSRMHDDDRDEVVNFCVGQSKAGNDHEADYRAMTKDGEYIWIRDVVHVVRDDNGDVESLIGFMFDITERKETELKLIALQKELEEFSFKDSLTDIANRRMFDSVLEREWINARRNQQPLSLIMFDIDFFKQYNDHYGHVKGDECLKKVAKTLSEAAIRSKDFLARFGGEEFALVLPETDAKAAAKIAERCLGLIFKQQIPHSTSSVSQVLTISIGVSSTIPERSQKSTEFLEAVDSLLYKAKQQGRNKVVAG